MTPKSSRVSVAMCVSVVVVCSQIALPNELASDVAMTAGDTRHLDVTLPVGAAFAVAQRERRFLFLKPVYGGLEDAGYND